MAERAVAEERRAALDRVHLRGGRGAVVRALAHACDHVVTAVGEHLLHRVEHVEQRLLADLDFAQPGQRRDARGQRTRHVGRLGCGGSSLPSVTISVPKTGPDEPPTVDMQVMPIVFSASLSDSPQRVALGLDGLRAALHVQAMVAVADGGIERGQLLDVINQRLSSRLR